MAEPAGRASTSGEERCTGPRLTCRPTPARAAPRETGAPLGRDAALGVLAGRGDGRLEVAGEERASLLDAVLPRRRVATDRRASPAPGLGYPGGREVCVETVAGASVDLDEHRLSLAARAVGQ